MLDEQWCVQDRRSVRLRSRFSDSLIDLKHTACGNAVAFQPNGLNFFLAHLVVEHVDWGEDWKGLFDRHLHHRIDGILAPFSAPERFRYKIEFRSTLAHFRAALKTEAATKETGQ